MPALTRAEKRKKKEAEMKAEKEERDKLPKPKPKPKGVTLEEPDARPYQLAGVGTVKGIKRGNPELAKPRLVTYVETEDELKKLLKAKEEKVNSCPCLRSGDGVPFAGHFGCAWAGYG
jgi:hypothetical protein